MRKVLAKIGASRDRSKGKGNIMAMKLKILTWKVQGLDEAKKNLQIKNLF